MNMESFANEIKKNSRLRDDSIEQIKLCLRLCECKNFTTHDKDFIKSTLELILENEGEK